MYLKSLEMQGFKSFPDKTKIEFNSGSTVIVGPNGSGKSNITDAMRWVLGEISSKNIRGTKMEDVVFAGADGRNPMGYAEVSVTFDNTPDNGKINLPYDEVTVTRRYYRAGESEYFINRRPCRLRDIHELFMNTGIGREGYSIVGQGRISEILSRKSEDRRTVFEEAAGISKYRHKRHEAERQLASAEENMLRVNDILSEIEGRVGPLEKEAEKAKKYLDIYEKKRKADISLTVYDSKRVRTEQKKAEDDFILSTHELEMIEDTVEGLEAQSERLSEASQNNKLSSERAYERIRELTAERSRLESEYRALVTDSARNSLQIEECEENVKRTDEAVLSAEAERAEVEGRIALLRSEYENAETVLAEKQAHLASSEAKLAELERRLEELFAEQKKHEDETVDLRVRLNVLKSSYEADDVKNASVSGEIDKYRAAADEYAEKAVREERNVTDYRGGIERANAVIAEDDAEISVLEAQLSELNEKRNAAAASLESYDKRIDALVRLEENFEGYGKSVKFVMDAYGKGEIEGKIYGPVSRLISVKQEYITAIETAFGANLQNIIVEDDKTAKAAIRALKNANAGRSTFYPVSAMKSPEKGREIADASRAAGYIGIASELTEYDVKYSGVIGYLIGRVCVFDTLDNAAAAAKASGYKIRAVTLDGQQINAGGSFTGGSARRDSGMLSRAGEIKSLRAERSLCERRAVQLASEIADKTQKRVSALSHRSGEVSRRDMMDAMMRAAMSERDTYKAQLDATEALIAQLRSDYDTRLEQKSLYETDMAELAEKLTAAEAVVSAVKEERSAVDVTRHEADDERLLFAAEVSAAQLASVRLDAEVGSAVTLLEEKTRRLDELCERKAQYLARAAELTENNRVSLESQDENRKNCSEIEKTLASAEAERAELESGGLEFEQRQVELRRKIREKTDEKEKIVRVHLKNEQKKAALAAEIDKLVAHLWDEYELTFSGAAELDYPEVTDENRNETYKTLTEYKNKLRALGSVNVGAIEEYKEVSERYLYLSRQMEDLRVSKDDLTAIINDLNADMEKAFADAFARINTRFGEVFRELFGGGNAEIYLSDPTDILSSGIEIKAAPPGKVIKNLSLLSGGEQSFVAIALLFAMIHVNPTPFCIFDEIESALDEVNVDRFANYIKRYSTDMQFVIVTHRRGTMETADSLYGITMPKHGISRVLALDVNDMEAKSKYASDSSGS